MTDAKEPLPTVCATAVALVQRGDRDLKKAEEFYVSAGLRFAELKARVKAGEAKEKTWSDYLAVNVRDYAQRTVDYYIAKAADEVEDFDTFEDHHEFRKADDVAYANETAKATSPRRDPEKRREQTAEAVNRHREKANALRIENGGKPKGTRRDPEHAALARRFAEIGKKLTAGELQITIELIEAEFPRLLVS